MVYNANYNLSKGTGNNSGPTSGTGQNLVRTIIPNTLLFSVALHNQKQLTKLITQCNCLCIQVETYLDYGRELITAPRFVTLLLTIWCHLHVLFAHLRECIYSISNKN